MASGGGGALESSIKEEVHRRGLEDRIRFYGDQNNPYRFLKNADLLLLPSIHEAAPMVIMEAKSLGVPVLSTDTISAKEMIIEGKEGFVCPNNEEGIYQDLRKILLNLQTLQECRDFLRKQNYSNDDALRHFEELIT
ncbi:glycosyltransferase [Alkalibacter rhizosphaerae]|uniref:Glycosyltransferase n=1 Tax=Alkalibacter rhizosphaerae TaxID=2815577 RepID=A0A974XGX1_9FIRM|nr:glycosyltransferase [Alkalibacter rhizosphaerae]QSX09598.1 glycosyltransferase [Alkalibacter rhizosphaerae]